MTNSDGWHASRTQTYRACEALRIARLRARYGVSESVARLLAHLAYGDAP